MSMRFLKTIGLSDDRNYVIENLAMLVASGMGVTSALDAIFAEMRSRRMRDIIQGVKEDIESGDSLAIALGRVGIFPGYVISLIRVGEQTGSLADSLKLIGAQQGKDRELRSKIQSALVYPIFVLCLSVVIGIGIAWFILPKLAVVFSQLRIALPAVTRALIWLGMFLGQHGIIAVPIFLACIAACIYIVFVYPKTKAIGQTMLLISPGIGRLLREAELARGCYLLGTLLHAGLPITRALDSLGEATEIPQYKRLYSEIRERLEEGKSFQRIFTELPSARRFMPIPVQQLIVAAEQSGSLSDVLFKISASYEAKTEMTTKSISVILEPILLVIVWLGVVAVAMAVILPIYSLVGGLQSPM